MRYAFGVTLAAALLSAAWAIEAEEDWDYTSPDYTPAPNLITEIVIRPVDNGYVLQFSNGGSRQYVYEDFWAMFQFIQQKLNEHGQ
jgi:hypothetical protein